MIDEDESLIYGGIYEFAKINHIRIRLTLIDRSVIHVLLLTLTYLRYNE